jgi:hypothetical protein
MSVFNIVRFRVKPGQETRFLDAHRNGEANWPGLLRGVMIKTGDRKYCLVGEWADTDALADLGVTDAVSGSVVLDLKHPS